MEAFSTINYIQLLICAKTFGEKFASKKTDNVNFLFATYNILIVYATYVEEILKIVLKSDSGMDSNGRLSSFFMTKSSNPSLPWDAIWCKLHAPQITNNLPRNSVTYPGVLLFNISLDQGATPERIRKLTEENVKSLIRKTMKIGVIGETLSRTKYKQTFLFLGCSKTGRFCFGWSNSMLWPRILFEELLYLWASKKN